MIQRSRAIQPTSASTPATTATKSQARSRMRVDDSFPIRPAGCSYRVEVTDPIALAFVE